MTEATKFQNSTMLQNYRRLLKYIQSQMGTDKIDRAERRVDTMKTYIRYYLEHMETRYKEKLFRIIPIEILKEKVLDVEFGFGDSTCERDVELCNTIAFNIYTEIKYYENICECGYIDKTKQVQCWYCDINDN